MTLVLKNADLSGKNIKRPTKKITGFRTCEQKDYDRIGLKNYVTQQKKFDDFFGELCVEDWTGFELVRQRFDNRF